MRCEQARQLFDAYLDGELSSSLATELGAHRVRCADCRRDLALLEVAGHIVSSDEEPVTVEAGFSDRLIACMDQPVTTPTQRWQRRLYIAGPLAAAAVVALAFIGVFDRPEGDRLGVKEKGNVEHTRPIDTIPPGSPVVSAPAQFVPDDQDERALEAWLEQTKENVDAKRQSGESLQRVLGLTVRQVLDIVKQAEETAKNKDDTSSATEEPDPGTPKTPPADGDSEIEDL